MDILIIILGTLASVFLYRTFVPAYKKNGHGAIISHFIASLLSICLFAFSVVLAAVLLPKITASIVEAADGIKTSMAAISKPAPAPAPLFRNEFKAGYQVCLSEDLFHEMTMAKINHDKNQLDYLLANGCGYTKSGFRISVIDTTLTGTAKVRIYQKNGESVMMWTNTEAVYE